MNRILNLRPVSYRWKKDGESDAIVDGRNYAIGPKEDDMVQYGFLAQEVEGSLPDVVCTSEDSYKGINYIALIPMLVESIQ